MYEQFYGLAGKPFRLTPDPSFLFDSAPHKRALSYLRYGIYLGEGFVTLSGPPGTGKTTLLKQILSELPEDVVVAKLVTTQLDAEDTLRYVAAALGIEFEGLSKAGLLNAIDEHLKSEAARGRRVLVVVDEAQHLAVEALEELRMLTNFQEGDRTLLQCFLIGQEALQELLDSPAMEQLRQRVVVSCRIEPMQGDETVAYIEHRLARAGWSGEEPLFTFGAYELIHRYSGGNPRRINALCDRILLRGYLEQIRPLDEHIVQIVIREMDGDGDDDRSEGSEVMEILRQTREAIHDMRSTLKVVDSGTASGAAMSEMAREAPAVEPVPDDTVPERGSARTGERFEEPAGERRRAPSIVSTPVIQEQDEVSPTVDNYIETAVGRMGVQGLEAENEPRRAPSLPEMDPETVAPPPVDASPYFPPRDDIRAVHDEPVVREEIRVEPPVAVGASSVHKLSTEENSSLLARIRAQLPNIGIGVIVVGLLAMIFLPGEVPRIYELESTPAVRQQIEPPQEESAGITSLSRQESVSPSREVSRDGGPVNALPSADTAPVEEGPDGTVVSPPRF